MPRLRPARSSRRKPPRGCSAASARAAPGCAAQGTAAAIAQTRACVALKLGQRRTAAVHAAGRTGQHPPARRRSPRRSPAPMPVYAIKPRGLDEGETPCQTHPRDGRIRDRPDQGGAAAGTLSARRLFRRRAGGAGDGSALSAPRATTCRCVMLLDTYPSRPVLAAAVPCRNPRPAGAPGGVGAAALFATAALIREIMRRVRQPRIGILRRAASRCLALPDLIPEGSQRRLAPGSRGNVQAGEAYRPSRYAGKVAFVQPEEVPNLEPQLPGPRLAPLPRRSGSPPHPRHASRHGRDGRGRYRGRDHPLHGAGGSGTPQHGSRNHDDQNRLSSPSSSRSPASTAKPWRR